MNPATADALEGELFGLPISEISERAGAPLDEVVTLVVRATVPQGAGSLPEDGVMTLNEGGVRELRVSGELLDAEIAAADAEAERLDERASRGARIAVIWWIVLAVIVVFVTVVALRGPASAAGVDLPGSSGRTWQSEGSFHPAGRHTGLLHIGAAATGRGVMMGHDRW